MHYKQRHVRFKIIMNLDTIIDNLIEMVDIYYDNKSEILTGNIKNKLLLLRFILQNFYQTIKFLPNISWFFASHSKLKLIKIYLI